MTLFQKVHVIAAVSEARGILGARPQVAITSEIYNLACDILTDRTSRHGMDPLPSENAVRRVWQNFLVSDNLDSKKPGRRPRLDLTEDIERVIGQAREAGQRLSLRQLTAKISQEKQVSRSTIRKRLEEMDVTL